MLIRIGASFSIFICISLAVMACSESDTYELTYGQCLGNLDESGKYVYGEGRFLVSTVGYGSLDLKEAGCNQESGINVRIVSEEAYESFEEVLRDVREKCLNYAAVRMEIKGRVVHDDEETYLDLVEITKSRLDSDSVLKSYLGISENSKLSEEPWRDHVFRC